uniref:Uncharacterized protein n=1 Tax=Arundo donax TaxID=35708 RepID=A0A0A8YDX7_ARUDO
MKHNSILTRQILQTTYGYKLTRSLHSAI